MARQRHPEDEGIPPSDDPAPNRPSDDDELQPPLPGDRPYEANDLVTPAEQRRGESLRTRVAREVPEPDPNDPPRSDASRPVGRLNEPTEDGRDVTGELVAEETDDDVGLAAEEAAVSIDETDETDENGGSQS